jgi:endonuclease/exonuclease/phosphatase family metal-dependent hydrolase
MFRKLAILPAFLIAVGALACTARPPSPPSPSATGPRAIVFCFWNVENLFDDRDDRRNAIDEVYDNPFARNAGLRREKFDRIAGALLRLNDGRGPDVIACVEVESVRAAELLRDTLNRRLDEAGADPALRYTEVAMKDLDAGRHIAPCVIARVPVVPGRTRLHGRLLRVLETHLRVNDHELCVIVSHWTSKVGRPDGDGGEAGRSKYAVLIRDLVAGHTRTNERADVLVCGDFNDTPGSKAVAVELGATGDRSRVIPTTDRPRLLDLLAEFDPATGADRSKDPARFGTIWYSGRPLVYDLICFSPGLLDREGLGFDPDSVRVPTEGLTARGSTRRQPWRFGDPENPPTPGRGYSDHFPVTVTLSVAPPGGGPGRPE